MGRPSDFNQELAETFCERIATSERGVRRVCEEDADMPDESTIYRWIARHDSFREMYARAKELQCYPIAERMRDVAADGRNDWMEIKDREGECVGYRENGEAIRRSALRVDTDKWLLAKLAPKKYSDRIQQEISGKDGAPFTVVVSSVLDRDK